MKALVICAGGGIGDVLLATPVMRALHARYDDVVALTTRAHAAVLQGNPDLAEVWHDDGVPFASQSGRIAAYGFDAAVVTWATLRSAALPLAGRIPLRVGQARRLYSALFNRRVTVRSELGDRTTHWTQILLDFARALDCDTSDALPFFATSPQAREGAAQLLRAADVAEPYAVLHPTRGIAGHRERWPVTRLGELGRALGETLGCRVIVSGASSDAPIADEVASIAGTGAVSLAGRTTLAEFGALAKGARAVVAMDSGPMHVAAAVGAPTVGIFALQSDEPDRWAPLGPRTAVVRPEYPCPPGHRKETCPDFACVANLDIARVLEALESLRAPRAEALP